LCSSWVTLQQVLMKSITEAWRFTIKWRIWCKNNMVPEPALSYVVFCCFLWMGCISWRYTDVIMSVSLSLRLFAYLTYWADGPVVTKFDVTFFLDYDRYQEETNNILVRQYYPKNTRCFILYRGLAASVQDCFIESVKSKCCWAYLDCNKSSMEKYYEIRCFMTFTYQHISGEDQQMVKVLQKITCKLSKEQTIWKILLRQQGDVTMNRKYLRCKLDWTGWG
jgi:hypothetical protein